MPGRDRGGDPEGAIGHVTIAQGGERGGDGGDARAITPFPGLEERRQEDASCRRHGCGTVARGLADPEVCAADVE
jgi:hypothetical protein